METNRRKIVSLKEEKLKIENSLKELCGNEEEGVGIGTSLTLKKSAPKRQDDPGRKGENINEEEIEVEEGIGIGTSLTLKKSVPKRQDEPVRKSVNEGEIRKVVKNILKEYYEEDEIKNNAKAYYIKWSSWFDSHPYDAQLISRIVVEAGGEDVHTENAYGWSNQPEVVVFNIDGCFVSSIKEALQNAIGTEWIIIAKKDW